MSKVIIPTPLRKFTNNTAQVEISGDTIQAAIQDLAKQHDGLSKHLFDDQGKIRSFIRIYLEDEDINALQKEQTAVPKDSTISIVPAIAGGV